MFIRSITKQKVLNDTHSVILNWIANNADKKGLQKFIDGEYSRNKVANPIKKEPAPTKVEKDWQRLALALKGKFK